ncbi:NIF-domain-containing protein [Choiromyces venosus 120613-1]|uniref:Mitochondrial import inner membrane translocase subunit TIM50 n=1 Tax=Choiromyces venosus 120613-1 TaxID=1336337 RepID=A0A3N4JIN1_9PEZI|nr:NIF-domain-containing protein [Choiromyces venosus 120613-1]
MLGRALNRSLLGARPLSAVVRAPRNAPPISRSPHYRFQHRYSTQQQQPPPSGKDPQDPSAAVSDPILPTDANASPLSSDSTRTPPQEASSSSSTSNPPPSEPQLPELEMFLKETEKAEKASSGGGIGRGGGGSLPKSAYISSTDRKRERLARVLFGSFIVSLFGGVLYMGRELDEGEKNYYKTLEQGWSAAAFTARVKARTNDLLNFYNEPPFEKLLPDPLPDYSRPYTLVISLEDVCVHSTWDREHGWRIAKRPGLDYFLAYLFQYYEIVVFTSQHEQTAAPIIQKMDQYPGYIMFPLFRAHTRYKGGKYIKDLNYLNRDLSKVIMLEANSDAWSENPNNTIKMQPWNGDPGDKGLISLIPFLEYIAAMGISDVRPVIEGFGDKHIPTEFSRREAIARAEHMKRVEEQRKNRKSTAGGALLRALGMNKQTTNDEKTFMDLARERGLQAYHEMQKHIEDHKEEMLQEQKKMEKEASEMMKTSLSKIFTEGLPKPPGAQ